MAKQIDGYLKLQVRGGQANPAPPVGPALGSKGINIMEATAVTKLLNFSSNFAAFIIFAIQGYVIWLLGLTMAVAQIAGAYTKQN